MKTIDPGQTIGILANIGVIAGILFLGYELRQNTQAVTSAASQGIQDQITEVLSLRLDESLAAINLQAGIDISELSPVDQFRFQTERLIALHALQNLYFQVQAGAYDAGRADGWWHMMRNNLEVPSMRDHWEQNKITLSQEFQVFVETEVLTRETNTGVTATGMRIR
jgi:hypothetical protein